MHYLKSYFFFGLFFFLLLSLSLGFDFSLCATPERAKAELGDDYYAFCEQNVAPAYHSDAPALAEEQQINPQPIHRPNAPEWVYESNYSALATASYTTNLRFIVAILAIVLSVVFCVLIIWRTHHQHLLTLAALNKLLPTLRAYQQAGYTVEQIKTLLANRGYTSSFINKVVKALEKNP